jgi:[calcium/calmodulin-dependent protein kinase] kinase
LLVTLTDVLIQVKPDNILLSADRETVKLCDFGVSEMFVHQGDDRIKKSGGSPAFLSPESFTGGSQPKPMCQTLPLQAALIAAAHSNEVHGKAVDIWALGSFRARWSSSSVRSTDHLPQASPSIAC